VSKIPERNNAPTAADVGLTAKAVHEARQIRDAERKQPGTSAKLNGESSPPRGAPPSLRLPPRLQLASDLSRQPRQHFAGALQIGVAQV
jgi:hypothetical protein